MVNPGWQSYERHTYSPAVLKGGWLFISGLNALGEDGVIGAPGDVAGQVRIIYEKMEKILHSAGATFDDVVRTVDYIIDRKGYSLTADVRREVFGSAFPAATGVVVKELLGRGVLIEVEATAVVEP